MEFMFIVGRPVLRIDLEQPWLQRYICRGQDRLMLVACGFDYQRQPDFPEMSIDNKVGIPARQRSRQKCTAARIAKFGKKWAQPGVEPGTSRILDFTPVDLHPKRESYL